MKSKTLLLMSVLVLAFSAVVQAAEKNDSTKINFHSAFDELKAMMEGKQTPSFERAVFISENPYYDNQYSYITFQNILDLHLFIIKSLAAANDYSDTMNYIPKVKTNGRFDIDEILISPAKKKELYKNAINNWAIFKYMNDTTGVNPLIHLPFKYSSSDPFGIKDWSNSQLINLLSSEKQEGNCYALTAFFKIMANRLKTDAVLCTAPQHIYIQHQDNKGDYYNVELATAGHPRDGMLQTLTYTTSTAIVNGISLRSYDDRQSIGLCMVNLAKAYEHKFNSKDDDFLLQCAETVLQNDSLNLNALLLKHQVLNERMLKIMSKNKTVSLSKFTNEQTFKELEKHLARLHRLGYIQMPMDVQEMALNGFQLIEGEECIDRNSKPFTIEGVPEEDNKYLTLTGGLFQEVFEPKKFEEYGQFTFDTETKTIAAVDTNKKNIFLIDPVAFAYDFGARIYDARLGRFLSIDPMDNNFPHASPYGFAANNPITNYDKNGEFPVQAIVGAIAGFLVDYASQAALNYYDKNMDLSEAISWENIDGKSLAISTGSGFVGGFFTGGVDKLTKLVSDPKLRKVTEFAVKQGIEFALTATENLMKEYYKDDNYSLDREAIYGALEEAGLSQILGNLTRAKGKKNLWDNEGLNNAREDIKQMAKKQAKGVEPGVNMKDRHPESVLKVIINDAAVTTLDGAKKNASTEVVKRVTGIGDKEKEE